MRDASTSPRPSLAQPQPSTSTRKRPIPTKKKKKRPKREFAPDPGSSEDVLWRDVVELLGGQDVVKALEEEGSDWQEPLERGQVVVLDVVRLSSTGARRDDELMCFS
jgi:tRNA (uracil-5-)-methyltransferase